MPRDKFDKMLAELARHNCEVTSSFFIELTMLKKNGQAVFCFATENISRDGQLFLMLKNLRNYCVSINSHFALALIPIFDEQIATFEAAAGSDKYFHVEAGHA